MIRARRSATYLLVTITCFVGINCHLRRPNTTPSRMIEPQILDPQIPEAATQVVKAPDAISIRLLDTQARGHIGRRLLHLQSNGELTEDAVWKWSSAPDRYLDTALRLEAASSPHVRLVDTGRAPAVAATLLIWDLEAQREARLVGAVEFQVTNTDRVVHTRVVRDSEIVSADLPGDLANAAGRLLHRLASHGLALIANER